MTTKVKSNVSIYGKTITTISSTNQCDDKHVEIIIMIDDKWHKQTYKRIIRSKKPVLQITLSCENEIDSRDKLPHNEPMKFFTYFQTFGYSIHEKKSRKISSYDIIDDEIEWESEYDFKSPQDTSYILYGGIDRDDEGIRFWLDAVSHGNSRGWTFLSDNSIANIYYPTISQIYSDYGNILNKFNKPYFGKLKDGTYNFWRQYSGECVAHIQSLTYDDEDFYDEVYGYFPDDDVCGYLSGKKISGNKLQTFIDVAKYFQLNVRADETEKWHEHIITNNDQKTEHDVRVILNYSSNMYGTFYIIIPKEVRELVDKKMNKIIKCLYARGIVVYKS